MSVFKLFPGCTSPSGLPFAAPPHVVVLVLVLLLGACANPSGTFVILQNQIPTAGPTAGTCVVSADTTLDIRQAGIFDIDLDQPYPYFVYPLLQNRLPSIMASGGIDRNSLSLRSVEVAIKAPAGIDPGWVSGCPVLVPSPVAFRLEPGGTLAVRAEGFRICHAQRMRTLIASGLIPSGLTQPVYFSLILTAVADRSGSQLRSDPFEFQVQVCAGCLQATYPEISACADTPKPNPSPGNPCNIAQDGPSVLCCKDPSGAVICPAPDF
jgi:hypothetical protein